VAQARKTLRHATDEFEKATARYSLASWAQVHWKIKNVCHRLCTQQAALRANQDLLPNKEFADLVLVLIVQRIHICNAQLQ
jgi:hypothetical protein